MSHNFLRHVNNSIQNYGLRILAALTIMSFGAVFANAEAVGIEAESADLSSGAAVLSNVAASGGRYVKLKMPATFSPRPLGSVETMGGGACPSGSSECLKFRVSDCAGVGAPVDGVMGVYEPSGSPRGLGVFFTGEAGTSFYSDSFSAEELLMDLRENGLKVVQVKWKGGWSEAPSGEESGFVNLSCRPASIIQYIHDTYYVPMDITIDKIGKCGFCVTGNSGGSSQIAYALSHYGLHNILDAVIPTAGPPHSAMAKGCLGEPPQYTYNVGPENNIDSGWGFSKNSGPCYNEDASWTDRWNNDSIGFTAANYYFAETRVHILVGADDDNMLAHSGDFKLKLEESGTPYMTYEIIPGVPHKVPSYPAGAAAIKRVLLGDTGVPAN